MSEVMELPPSDEHIDICDCKNCGHQIIKIDGKWKHYSTEGNTLNTALECHVHRCSCKNPEPPP